MRGALGRLSSHEYALMLVFHHISIDRGSSQSFIEQLTALYDCLQGAGNLYDVKAPSTSYAAFSVWHNGKISSDQLADDLTFWKHRYSDAPSEPAKLLPFAKAQRPTINDYQRAIVHATLSKAAHRRMKRVAARVNASPFQLLLAAFRAYLYRWTEDDDMTVILAFILTIL